MAPSDWAVLMPMTAEQSPQKWGIVTLLVSFPEGTWLGGDELAELTGVKWARRPLTELVSARVLDRDDGGGSSSQFWYRVNPRWWEWEVRWRHSIARVGELLSDWKWRISEDPIDIFGARPSARHTAIGARLTARHPNDERGQRAVKAAMARGEARAKPVIGADPKEVARAGARAISESRALGRAPNQGSREEEEISSCSRDTDSSSSDSSPAPVVNIDSGRKRQLTPDEEKARGAVLTRCVGQAGRRPFLKGWPAEQLYDLVGRYGVVDVASAAAQIPSGMELPPRFVELLADVLAAGAGADRSPSATDMERPVSPEPPLIVLADDAPVPAPAPESSAGQLLQRAANFPTQRTKTG